MDGCKLRSKLEEVLSPQRHSWKAILLIGKARVICTNPQTLRDWFGTRFCRPTIASFILPGSSPTYQFILALRINMTFSKFAAAPLEDSPLMLLPSLQAMLYSDFLDRNKTVQAFRNCYYSLGTNVSTLLFPIFRFIVCCLNLLFPIFKSVLILFRSLA